MFWTSVVSIPVQVTTAPDFTAYSAFPLPKMPNGTMAPRTYGGTGKNGVVNAKGPKVDESLKYVKWLTEKEQESHLHGDGAPGPDQPGRARPGEDLAAAQRPSPA